MHVCVHVHWLQTYSLPSYVCANKLDVYSLYLKNNLSKLIY